MTEAEIPETGYKVGPMTVDLLPSVVELEEACGLNSRGLEGYRKILSNPQSVLLVALAPVSPMSHIGPVSLLGAFSGEVVVDELQIDNRADAVEVRAVAGLGPRRARRDPRGPVRQCDSPRVL